MKSEKSSQRKHCYPTANNIGIQFKGKDQAFFYHAKLQKCQDIGPTLSELLNSIRSTNVRRPLNHIRRIREQLLRMNKLAAWSACTILIFGFCILRSLQIYSQQNTATDAKMLLKTPSLPINFVKKYKAAQI